jgi:hypothetical protein
VITIEIDDDEEEDEKEETIRKSTMPVRSDDDVVPPGYRRRHAFESPFFDDPVTGLRPVTPPSSDDDDEEEGEEEVTEVVEYDRLFDDDLTNTAFSSGTELASSTGTLQRKPFTAHGEDSVWSLLMLLERKINSGQVTYCAMEARWLVRLSAKYTQLEKKPV